MNINLTFHKTLAGTVKNNVDSDIWNKAVKLFEDGNYADSVRECIRFINPSIESQFANAGRTEYNVPHGSIIVHLKVTEQDFFITAPFLNIETSKKIPVMRQAAQLNFLPLALSHIVMEGEQLFFKFSCPLDLCEPYKIYDVLREICINADYYDDEFITKFGARRIQEPKVYPYTQEQKITAWNTMQHFITEAFEMYEQLENKRLSSFLWDIVVITILKIDYYCAPQGRMRSEIEKTLVYLAGKEDYSQRLSTGKDFLKKLQTYDRASFEQDLYSIDVFIPYKFRANTDTVRNGLQYSYDTACKEIKALDHTGAVFTLQYGILNLFYNNNVDTPIMKILTETMEQASGKPMEQASSILLKGVKQIMTTENLVPVSKVTFEPVKGEQKGFFKKLFGG
jgi:hypothetical protein